MAILEWFHGWLMMVDWRSIVVVHCFPLTVMAKKWSVTVISATIHMDDVSVCAWKSA